MGGDKLHLPGKMTWKVLSVALALAGGGCGDDDVAPADAAPSDVATMDVAPPPDDAGDMDAGEDAEVFDAMMDDAMADVVDRDEGPADAEPFPPDFGPPVYFCIYDSSFDSGVDLDAATCSGSVPDPDDCPPGCRGVG